MEDGLGQSRGGLDEETAQKSEYVQEEDDGGVGELEPVGDPVAQIAEHSWRQVGIQTNERDFFVGESSSIEENAKHATISPVQA